MLLSEVIAEKVWESLFEIRVIQSRLLIHLTKTSFSILHLSQNFFSTI